MSKKTKRKYQAIVVSLLVGMAALCVAFAAFDYNTAVYLVALSIWGLCVLATFTLLCTMDGFEDEETYKQTNNHNRYY